MPKLSPEERAALQKQLDDDAADDDDNEDVEIGKGDEYYRGSRRGARAWAAARGMKLEPDPAPEGDDTGKGSGKSGSKAGGEVRRFSGRRIS